jgi:voltage-gated potassium channel
VNDPTAGLRSRLRTATFFFALVLAAGTLSYWSLGHGQWSLFDCFYMTLITLSTVGYGEVLHGLDKAHGGRAITAALIVLGSGTLLYFVSTITALFVEGDLQGIIKRRKMERTLENLKGHAIVCGVGSTGRHVVNELLDAGHPCVVIDFSQAVIDELAADRNQEIIHVIGSAIDDHALHRAGIERAAIVVAALTHDTDNLFVTITARAFNPTCKIVAKCVESTTERKLRRAGATSVVSPNFIGGMRMASEVLRPNAVAFLDRMLRDEGDEKVRIEELEITPGSRLVGRKLSETSLRNEGALVIALRHPSGEFVYNPPGSLVLEASSVLIILVEITTVKRLRVALAKNELA